ncbi:hypothetical protein Cgig2_005644 [Carnegiea gigantea]|uniref:Cytochrome P450 n=1 Tax=Carnegiea gigantea TaxID=171969 RepID=A0A9Q1QPD2_9CARY|nr:hypothetical protein Cgig2_005644 [Carnegiea gigantea]
MSNHFITLSYLRRTNRTNNTTEHTPQEGKNLGLYNHMPHSFHIHNPTNKMTLLVIAVLICLPFLMYLFRAQPKPGPALPPGPRPLPTIGNLHMLGHLPHRTLAKLAHKYGPILSLRLGHVPAIVVSCPKAAGLFLKRHDAIFAGRPMIQATEILSYGARGMDCAQYGKYWRRVRKMCTLHLLNPTKVASFEGLRRVEIEAAVRRLVEFAAAREVADVGEKMVVGKGKEDDKRYDLKGVIEEASPLAGAFNLADFVPYLAPLDLQGLSKTMKDLSKRIDEIFENIIDDHLKEEDFTRHKDILGNLVALMKNPNNEFISPFDREPSCLTYLSTSVVTITWALAALIKHPRVMKLLQEELDSVIGKERIVIESDLPKLPFLDMVVKETFRLYPVAPFLVPRESVEDVTVNGYKIPQKSRIMINFWAIGRDPNVWSENAEEFYPERFIGRDIDVQGQDFELIPFGAGRRGYPGMQLDLLTVKLVVAQFAHCFTWELPNGMQPEKLDMNEEFGLSMPRSNKLLAIPSYRL